MSEPTVQTYVVYLYPGFLFAEEKSVRVEFRDPQSVAKLADENAFGFYFQDVMVSSSGCREMRSAPYNQSGTYYINGDILTANDVKKMPGDNRILLSNMSNPGWGVMVKCRTGNFRPLLDADEVVRI